MNCLKVLTEDNCGFDLSSVASTAYEELGQTAPLSIEISFVSEEEIRALNKEQRNTDKVTDVLSFPYLDDIRHEILTVENYPDDVDDEGNLLIGSVCICLKRAEEQAAEYGHSVKREVCYLALHGILHCFGFDHMTDDDEAEMTEIAEKIMNKLNITRDGQ